MILTWDVNIDHLLLFQNINFLFKSLEFEQFKCR